MIAMTLGRAGSDERGGATVFAVMCLGVVLVIGSALGVVAAMVAAYREAQSAADLAALAAATSVADGGGGCDAGAGVAAANGATQTSCRIDGTTVTVEVRVAGPHWLGQRGDLTASARAGPA